MTIPTTWIDRTDDVCPRPRYGLCYADPDEQDKAESNMVPHREQAPYERKLGSGRRNIDLKAMWKGRYESERDWLLELFREHRTAEKVGEEIGISKSTVLKRAKLHSIPVVKGWHGGMVV